MKVFICEDDQDILELMEILIQDLGYEVEVSTNCENVISDLERIMPNLIIMDYWIGQTKADEIIRRIKQIPTLKQVPLILVSAIDNLDNVARSLPINANIKKPFDISVFQSQVINFLDR